MSPDVKLCHYDFVCVHAVMNQLSESHGVSLFFFLFQPHPPVLVFLHACSVFVGNDCDCEKICRSG